MACTNCGHNLKENFCPYCGEKRFDKKNLTVKHFTEETFEGFLHLDNKFLSSLKLLFTKPGLLSLDHVEGRQTRHMKPIAFFLVLNLLFFLVMIIVNPYSLSLYNYITYHPFINYNTQHIIHEKLKTLHLTLPEYTRVFDVKMHSDSKGYIFAFIPVYGLISWLLFIKYRRLAVEHLVFATHFVAFILCYFFLQIYLLIIPFYYFTKIPYSPDFDNISSLMTAIIIGGYFAIASRRFYKASMVWSVITGCIIAFSFFELIQAYRMLLFFKIVYFKYF
ncbi:DUF3667 domain-containing protein [Mucilaginibacter sp. UYCu711]|uniref:DUF3667 domain-containing protein n=1 Tax=Mucilaginibacter sp. UYCu711 TaxID=3156339 RepID=UPI003D23A37B